MIVILFQRDILPAVQFLEQQQQQLRKQHLMLMTDNAIYSNLARGKPLLDYYYCLHISS